MPRAGILRATTGMGLNNVKACWVTPLNTSLITAGAWYKKRVISVWIPTSAVFTPPASGPVILSFPALATPPMKDLDSFNVDNQVSKTANWGDWQHHLLAGFDYQHLNSHMRYRYGTVNPGIDMQHPDYSQVTSDNLGLYTATKQRLSYYQQGWYLQDQVVFGGLNLVASIRYDNYHSTTTNNLDNDSKSWVSQQRVTKRLGALYQFDNGIAPYVSYSEGFLAGFTAGNAHRATS